MELDQLLIDRAALRVIARMDRLRSDRVMEPSFIEDEASKVVQKHYLAEHRSRERLGQSVYWEIVQAISRRVDLFTQAASKNTSATSL